MQWAYYDTYSYATLTACSLEVKLSIIAKKNSSKNGKTMAKKRGRRSLSFLFKFVQPNYNHRYLHIFVNTYVSKLDNINKTRSKVLHFSEYMNLIYAATTNFERNSIGTICKFKN